MSISKTTKRKVTRKTAAKKPTLKSTVESVVESTVKTAVKKIKKSKLETEILSYLNKMKVPERQEMFKGEKYIGGGQSKLQYMDLVTADVRSILKKNLSVFKLPVEKQFEAFQEVWFSTEVFEVKMVALYWVMQLKDEALIKFVTPLIEWAKEIDNWATSDMLSSVYSRVFEKSPSLLLSTFKVWNRHANPWLRRQSLVSLYYYARMRKRKPSFFLSQSFVSRNFFYPEYYVQKAVGWTLREMYQTYPEQTLELIKKNVSQLSSVAWVAATEKLPAAIKKPLLETRKKNRRE